MSEAVRILRIAAGGDGVGRLADGRTVFIPRTAPGDEVEPSDIRLHARFARARIGRLLRDGPDRIEPPCRHYREDDCGGCQLQHLNAGAQVSARRTIVGDALRRIGKIDLPDPELETGPVDLHYRAKITLTVDGGGTRAGFYRVDEATGVFDLERCEIADERLNQVWGALRSATRTWPPALRQIVLRVGRDGAVHVVFRGPVRPDPTLSGSVGGFIWWEPPASAAAPVSELPDAAAIPPGVFEQVHPAMGERVRQWALDQLAVRPGQHVWDLYAGIGETTTELARAGATVETVELDREAVLVAERHPLPGVVRHAGRVEDWVGRLRSPDAVITNPPRTGMEGKALTALLSAGPGVVVYISCNPATLARDLSRLRARYQVTAIRSFDLFPQTAHVESVVRLEQT